MAGASRPADPDGETDAADRLAELDGIGELVDLADGEDDEINPADSGS